MTKVCFVIMPFSRTTEKHDEQYWSDFFNEFIAPHLEELGYTCIRSNALPNNIIDNILKYLYNSDLVLAVLTDYNPNVWYELGIRHSIRPGTIMIIEKGQMIPFDVSSYGLIQYEDSAIGANKFSKEIQNFIHKIETGQMDNPSMEFAMHGPWARLWVLKGLCAVCFIMQKQIEHLLGSKINDFHKLEKREIESYCKIFESIVRRMDRLRLLGYFTLYSELETEFYPFFKNAEEQLRIGFDQNSHNLSVDEAARAIKKLKNLVDRILREEFRDAPFLETE